MGIETATILGGILSAGGAIASADIAGKASKEAAAEQSRAQEANLAEQRAAREQALAIQQPFIDVGQQAAQQLFQSVSQPGLSPFAQTQLDASEEATNRFLASRGLFGSGRAADVLTSQASQIAGQDVSRQQSILGGLLSSGQQAAGLGGQFASRPVLQQPITSGILGGAQAQVSGLGSLASIGSGTLQNLAFAPLIQGALQQAGQPR
jgi:hypothetical protein